MDYEDFPTAFNKEYQQIAIKSRTMEERGLGSDSLCSKCRYGFLYRRKNKLELHVFCNNMGRGVPSDIVECSRFMDKKSLSLNEMNELAVPIDARVGIRDGAFL